MYYSSATTPAASECRTRHACAVESCQSTLDNARTLSLSAHAQILLSGSGGAHGGSTLFLLSLIIITIIIIVTTATHPLPVLIMAS